MCSFSLAASDRIQGLCQQFLTLSSIHLPSGAFNRSGNPRPANLLTLLLWYLYGCCQTGGPSWSVHMLRRPILNLKNGAPMLNCTQQK